MTMLAIDISDNNRDVANWQELYNNGVRVACIKATGGTWYISKKYKDQVAGARSAGIQVVHYHYLYEGIFPSNLIAEMDFFLSVVGAYEVGDRFALDLEEPKAYGDLHDVIAAAGNYLFGKTRTRPLLYVNNNDLTRFDCDVTEVSNVFDLWQAQWYYNRKDNPLPPPFSPWEKWTIWQYTEQGYVVPIGPVDEDIIDMTPEEWRATGVPAIANDARAESYIDTNGEPITIIHWGGTTSKILGTDFVNVGITVEAAHDPNVSESRSLIAGQFHEWVEVPKS